MSPSDPFDIDLLLSQRDWLAHLARRLVGDGADDLAQDSFLRALSSRPHFGGDARAARGWLARVARNLAHNRAREAGRRAAREAKVARPEAAPPRDLALEAEAGRRLLECVLALGEPSRSTLLLRAFEGRSTAELARLQGVSEAAARKRVSRALAELRAALERERGPDWRAGLLPLARRAGQVGASGAPAAGAGALVAGALALLAAGGAVLVVRSLAPPPAESAVAATLPIELPAAPAPAGDAPAAAVLGPVRAERRDAAPPAVAPPAPRIGGELAVRVLSAADDTPLAGARVSLVLGDRPRGARVVPGSRGRLGELVTTGEDGWADFDDVGTAPLRLSVDGSPVRHESANRDLEHPPGRPQEEVVRLEPSPVLPFHARLVERETGKPIAGARVFVDEPDGREGSSLSADERTARYELQRRWEERGRHATTTDGDGRFTLEWHSWEDDQHARVHAAGYGPVVVAVTDTRAHPADPRLVRASRPARLVGTVRGENGDPWAGVRVSVAAPTVEQPDLGDLSGPSLAWERWTGADGTFVLEGLPAWTLIDVHLERGNTQLGDTLEFELAPGEERVVSWTQPSSHTLRGVVRDEHGRALAGTWVSLERAWDARSSGYLTGGYDARTVRVDDAGAFVFESVERGTWLVGPRPPNSRSLQLEYVPTYQRVELPPDAAVTLTARSGTFIAGRVHDADGTGFGNVGLQATPVGGSGLVRTRSKADGSYRLGPLDPGAHEVSCQAAADARRGTHVSPRAKVARAGDNGVDFELVPACRIVGRSSEFEHGPSLEAKFDLVSDAKSMSSGIYRETWNSGSLPPGSYSLIARTRDGRVGAIHGITLAAGETREDLIVRVSPGALLAVRNAGSSTSSWRLFVDERPYGFAYLLAGRTVELAVPPGEVRLVSSEDEGDVRRIRAMLGERVELSVGE